MSENSFNVSGNVAGKFPRSAFRFLLLSAALFVYLPVFGSQASEGSSLKAGRYFIRVSHCDDGCRAYINGTLVVNVGFDEDSNWLDITKDLVRAKNEVKFEVVNKTGAITYDFQIRKDDEIVYSRVCGKVKIVGCEENRAFRVGSARRFTYLIAGGGRMKIKMSKGLED